MLYKLFRFFLVAAFLLLCQLSRGQAPVPNFSASMTSGCAPLIVKFTDLSSNSPTSWSWDLGNGTISSVQNPVTTYSTPGNYNVKLVATNGNGSSTVVKNAFITIYASPSPSFSTPDTLGCSPFIVHFTGQSAAGSGTITSWEWNFGNGNSSVLQNPVAPYSAPGVYGVSLKVINSFGCTKSISRTAYIKVGQPFATDYNYSVLSGCNFPVSIAFNNQSVGQNLKYSWQFGDGQSTTQASPKHDYLLPGNYTATLISESPEGCKDSVSKVIALPTKTTSFSGPDSICKDVAGTFTVTSTPAPNVIHWDMGDGTTYNTASISHAYASPGNYTITLINDFGGCPDTVSRSIVVNNVPSSDFSVNNTAACKVPATFLFNAQQAGALQYLWDFGDGTTSAQQNPSHTYNSFGDYTVKLTVKNSLGCFKDTLKQDYIKVRKPAITITNAQVADCVPYTFTPSYSISSSEPVSSLFWDFGDGFTSTDPIPTHVYNVQGNYTLKVVITTGSGCTDTLVMPATIKVGNPINIDFTAAPTSVCASQYVQFTPNTSGVTVDSYNWDFGDGVTSAAQNPSYRYRDTGLFTVKLEVINNGCKSTVTKSGIQVYGSIANFTFTKECSVKGQFAFNNLSINADSLIWDFGDGTKSNANSPTHTYSSDGLYVVSLIAINNACADTFYRTAPVWFDAITANTPTPVVCKEDIVTFNFVHPQPNSVVNYYWNFTGNFNDGFISSNSTPRQYQYNKSGNFGFIGIAEDIFGCRDTIVIPQMVRSNGPVAKFGVLKTQECTGRQVFFLDSSTTDGVNAIQQWQWDFGDGVLQSYAAPPFYHTYLSNDSYDVRLMVTDQFGCTDGITKSNFVEIKTAKANFSSKDTSTCIGRNVSFESLAQGNIIGYKWDFGDGDTSIQRDPSHTYNSNGLYNVRLIATASPGCSDTLIKSQYIKIDMPVARFRASDTLIECAPIEVDFIDSSHYVEKWKWFFGDGNESTIEHPTNQYFSPGDYVAKLIVVSPGGCTDSAFQSIIIKGPRGSLQYGPYSGCPPLPVQFEVTTSNAFHFIWDFGDGLSATNNNPIETHSYTVGGTFTPIVFIGDTAGCFIPLIGATPIYSEKLVPAFSGSDTVLCDNGVVNFTNLTQVPGATTYQWSFGDGGTSSLQNPTHSYATTGRYDVTLRTLSPLGCRDTTTKSAYIKVAKSPIVSFVSDSILCENSTTGFVASLAPDTSAIIMWQWAFGNGQNSNLQNPPGQTFLPGNYTNKLTVTNSSGCVDSTFRNLRVYAVPVLQMTTDTTICVGTSANLYIQGATDYVWQAPGSATLSCTTCPNPVATPSVNTTYHVTASNSVCVVDDSIVVQVLQKPTFQVGPDQVICFGKSVRLTASGTQLYMWSPSVGLNDVAASNPVASPGTTTRYKVMGFDTLGCFVDSGNITVTVIPLPTVELGPDVEMSAGNLYTFQPTVSADVINYVWSPSNNLNCTTCPNPVSNTRDNITYYLQVQNSNGCYARDSIKLNVTCDGNIVYIPNTFSPNGDGMNDVFYPRGKGIYRVHSMKIFNRWGIPVFEKKDLPPNDPFTAWDGTSKGEKQPLGIYTYVIEIVCNSQQILKFYGTIQLIQ